MSTMTNAEALEAYEFASTEKLERAFLAGQLTEQQTKSLLCRKAYTMKQVGYLLKDWKSTKKFLAEEAR